MPVLQAPATLTTPVEQCLAFALSERAGRVPLGKIQDEFASMPAAYAAGRDGLAGLLRPPVVDFLFGSDVARQVHAELERACLLDCAVLADGTPGYPPLLAQTKGRPAVLYVRGNPAALQRAESVAIVGCRTPTDYGTRVAHRLAADLAARGVVVVSGLATGIDACAHAGALAGKGLTAAILGSGVDQITPQLNRRLGERILAAGGAIASEFPLGTPPYKDHFPRRNRVIAGLSQGTVVVEAREQSGSNYTMFFSLEANRVTMAVPGSIDSLCSAGPNMWLHEGARPVRSAADVLQEVGLEHLLEANAPAPAGTSAPAAAVLAALARGPARLDHLSEETGLEAAGLLATLTELELRGRVTRAAGAFALR